MICFYQTRKYMWSGLDKDDLLAGVIVEIEFETKPTGLVIYPIFNGVLQVGHTAYNCINLETGQRIRTCAAGILPQWLNDPLLVAIRLEQFKKEKHENEINGRQSSESACLVQGGAGPEKHDAAHAETGAKESPEVPQVGQSGPAVDRQNAGDA